MQVDLIIQNANVYNSFTKTFIPNNVVVNNGKFLYIGKNITDFTATTTLNVENKFLVPGLIDIHMHIDSAMATPRAFAHECARHGVTTIISEPHEIANVFGIKGVQAMLSACENSLIDIFFGVPSSVPSTNTTLETTGGEITLDDLKILLKHPKVICLGEVMNYVDVIYKTTSKTLDLINYTKNNYPHLAIEGHCPRIADIELAKMLYAGVESDHTQQSVTGIVDRFLQGMFVELQSKSLKTEIIEKVAEYNMYERIALVTDDIMADEFVEKGQLDKNLRKLIQLGMSPEQAIYIATYTPARHIGWRDRGAIASGKTADFFITDNIHSLPIIATYKNGQKIYDHLLEHKFAPDVTAFPDSFSNSIKAYPLKPEQLLIQAPAVNSIICNTMEMVDDATFTKASTASIPVSNGYLDWSKTEYALVVCLERYGKNNKIAFGLAKGACLKKGAIASSYAHDHHNIIAIGCSQQDLLLAINQVIEMQGGYCAVNEQKVLSELPLPIGGILSPLPLDELAIQMTKLKVAFTQLGYSHKNPIMSMGTLSLPVSPELKISDQGLIDVKSQKIISLFA